MTCREKLMETDCAHNVHPDYVGGVFGCPHITYPNISGLKDMPAPEYCKDMKSHKECTDCWDREIPEEGDTVNLYHNGRIVETMLVEKPHILDSGNRREFDTGAVRDIQEGKGRCDLLPLDIIGRYLNDDILDNIAHFQRTGSVDPLYEVLWKFSVHWDDGKCRESKHAMMAQYNTTMLLEVAKHYEEGRNKYGARNWEKGIPVRCYIDSAVRHYLKFIRGDKDEPHDRAFVWNMLGAIWTCVHKPELCEYPIKLEVEG